MLPKVSDCCDYTEEGEIDFGWQSQRFNFVLKMCAVFSLANFYCLSLVAPHV